MRLDTNGPFHEKTCILEVCDQVRPKYVCSALEAAQKFDFVYIVTLVTHPK